MSPTPKKAARKPAAKAAPKPAKKPAKKPEKKVEKKLETTAAPEPRPEPPAVPALELIDMARLAGELRQPLLQVRKMVQTGQIPGVKVDGEWRFNLQLVREALLRRSRGR